MHTLRLRNTFRRRLAGEELYCLKVKFTTLTRLIRYPPNPNPGRITPIGAPNKSPSGGPLFASNIGTTEAGDTAVEALIGGNENTNNVPGFHIPGCGDKYNGAGSKTQPPNPPPVQTPPSPPEEPGESTFPSSASTYISLIQYPVLLGRWHYKYGDASKGEWAMYLQPGRTVGRKEAKRSSANVKRLGVPPPPPQGPSADAEVGLPVPRILPCPSPAPLPCSFPPTPLPTVMIELKLTPYLFPI